jgi:hypothetical protein
VELSGRAGAVRSRSASTTLLRVIVTSQPPSVPRPRLKLLRLPGRHEDLLGHVLGVGPGAQGAQRDAVDQRPEPLVDERERVRLPATEGSRDILIRRLVHQKRY